MRPDPHDRHLTTNAGPVDSTTSATRQPVGSRREPDPVTVAATDQQLPIVTEPSPDDLDDHEKAHLTPSNRGPNRSRAENLRDLIWAIAIVCGLILALIVMSAVFPDTAR